MGPQSIGRSRLDRLQDLEARGQRVGWRVCPLAEACGITPRALLRFFRLKYGMSPHEWLAQRRLARALPLLLEPKLVKEVAGETGFDDPAHFTRLFKLHYGIAPSAWRIAGKANSSTVHPRRPKAATRLARGA